MSNWKLEIYDPKSNKFAETEANNIGDMRNLYMKAIEKGYHVIARKGNKTLESHKEVSHIKA